MSDHRFHDDGDTVTCGECGREWCGICTPTPAARCPFEYDHEDEEPAFFGEGHYDDTEDDGTPQRPTLLEEAERLLDYWERHGDSPEVVAKWAMQDMLGILRYIVEEQS